MAEIRSLSAARAEKEGDCRLWTARDALVDLLAQLDAGNISPTQLVVHYLEDSGDGGQKYHYTCAGVTFPQHIALLELAKHRVLRDWIN